MKTIAELKTICRRQQACLLQDAVGVAALVVMLFVALHLPYLS